MYVGGDVYTDIASPFEWSLPIKSAFLGLIEFEKRKFGAFSGSGGYPEVTYKQELIYLKLYTSCIYEM